MQPSLFQFNPDSGETTPLVEPQGVRRTDPNTSRAALTNNRTKIGKQQHIVMAAVTRWPDRTSAELAELIGGGDVGRLRHVLARRLPELRRGGYVKNGPARVCRVTDNKAMTWEVS